MDLQETQFCSNCRREVSSANYVIHSAHCARNVKLCPVCDEPVAKSEFEEHIKEVHGTIACKDCKEPVEKGQLESHLREDCAFRTMRCEFCDLDCLTRSLEEHEKFCGSRTELCEVCGAHVMISEFQAHEKNHWKATWNLVDEDDEFNQARANNRGPPSAAVPDEDVFLPCEVCKELFPMDVLSIHQAVCDNEQDHPEFRKNDEYEKENWMESFDTKWAVSANLNPQLKPEENEDQPPSSVISGNGAEMVPCEYCHMMIHFEDFAQHEVTCSLYTGEEASEASSTVRSSTADTFNSLEEKNPALHAAEQRRREFMRENEVRVETPPKDKTVTLPDGTKMIKKPNTSFKNYATNYENVNILGSGSKKSNEAPKLTIAERFEAMKAAKETGARPKKPSNH